MFLKNKTINMNDKETKIDYKKIVKSLKEDKVKNANKIVDILNEIKVSFMLSYDWINKRIDKLTDYDDSLG